MERGRLVVIERWFLRAGAFILPLAYWWDTYDRYVLPKLLLARILVIGLLILFVARMFLGAPLTIKRTPLDLPLLAFIASAFLSTLSAENQNAAVFGTYSRYDGLLTILMYAALFWLSAQAITGPTEARTLLRFLLASGYLVALVAIVLSVTDSMTQGVLVPAFGTLGQKNVLGAFLAMLIPLAYRELVDAASWNSRIVALNVLVILGLAIILTLSRSAWLGTGVAAVVLAVGGYRPTLRLGLACLLIVLLAALIVGSLRTGRVPMTPVDQVGASGDRPAVWRDTLGLIASRPLLGYGPDNFGLVFPRFQTTYLGPQPWDKAHAESLQVAATQGLVGLAAYIVVLVAFVRAFWRGRHRNTLPPPLAGEGGVGVAIFAGWVAYEVTLQLNFSALAASLPFWIFAAAAMESWRLSPAPLVEDISLPRSRGRAGVGAACITIASLTALAAVATVFPYLADSHLRMAVAADVQGRPDAAGNDARQARDLAPRESVYAVEVGNIAFERHDWLGAASAYGDAASLGTYNPLVYRNLALADRNLGRRSEARIAAQKAVELNRFDPANRALLAQFGPNP